VDPHFATAYAGAMQEPAYPNSLASLTDAATQGGARVAILMRTRDRPVLLARALASVLSQTHQDWHLLLVNDGGDPLPLDRLVARHETGFQGRISVLHRPESQGMEAASNAALDLAVGKGRFQSVVVHDDDDSWHPDFLARTTAWLDAPEHRAFAAVMSHWMVVRERMDADGVVEDGRDWSFFDMPVLHYASILQRNRFPPICLLVRWSVVEAAGRFNAALPVLGDWDYTLRIMALGDIGVLPERLACYHHRDTGTLPDYLNTAAPGRHETQLALYRNARLRALAQSDPAMLPLAGELGVQAERYHEQAELQHTKILANLDRNGLWGHARHEDLQHRLVRVEETLARIESALATSLARAPLWRRLARRAIDRLRRPSA
jgi:glycosyltransferase involved in cell wall biosynthesis